MAAESELLERIRSVPQVDAAAITTQFPLNGSSWTQGIELPASIPESLVVIALGALATIFVLIRLIDVPDAFFGWSGRGIGIFISLLASLAVVVAGLLRAGEEL